MTLDTCTHCNGKVIFTNDYCPSCNRSRTDGTLHPSFASAQTTHTASPRPETESGFMAGFQKFERMLSAPFRGALRLLELTYSTERRLGRVWLLKRLLCSAALGLLATLAGFAGDSHVDFPVFRILIPLPVVPAVFVWYGRRFKDLDMNPWFAAGLLVPPLNFMLLVLLFFLKGSSDGNRYGAPPH